MSKWEKPITDRTAADILNRTSKAFFNIADWLRIRGNTEQVKLLLELVTGIEVAMPDAVTISTSTIMSVDAVNDLVKTIDALVQGAKLSRVGEIRPLQYNYVAGAGGTSPTYLDVNDWELDLLLVRNCLGQIARYQVFTGVAVCGQPKFWQVRFRIFPFVKPLTSWTRATRSGFSVLGATLTRQNKFRRY